MLGAQPSRRFRHTPVGYKNVKNVLRFHGQQLASSQAQMRNRGTSRQAMEACDGLDSADLSCNSLLLREAESARP